LVNKVAEDSIKDFERAYGGSGRGGAGLPDLAAARELAVEGARGMLAEKLRTGEPLEAAAQLRRIHAEAIGDEGSGNGSPVDQRSSVRVGKHLRIEII
jgi:hypothetical protein